MAINGPYISSTQVASSVPFDQSTGKGFIGSDVQSVLQELRDYTIEDVNSTATTASGTLTITSPTAGGDTGTGRTLQILTGTATGYSVVLPNATTLTVGQKYQVCNTSSQAITVKTNGGATLVSQSAGTSILIILQTNGTAVGVWLYYIFGSSQSLAAGNAGDVQFRGATAGTFAANASGYFNWNDTTGSLQVGTTGGPAFSNNPLGVTGNASSFLQINNQNLSNSAAASTDYIATADTGSDIANYLDMGINSSGYSDPAFNIVGALDAYVYASNGNIAVGSAAQDFILFAGGTLHANEVARGSASGYFQQNLGRVHVPNFTATTASGTVTLTSMSQSLQILTGTATGYKVILPSALTIVVGQIYEIYNTSSQSINLADGSGANLTYIPPNSVIFCILQAAGSVGGTWITHGDTIGTASGIVNYKVSSSTAFSTGSNTDVIITGMTVVPTQGTYAIWYNYSGTNSGSGVNQCSIYNGASQVADSVRQGISPSGTHVFNNSTMTTSTFNGTNACAIYVNTSSSTFVTNQRSMILTRLGN